MKTKQVATSAFSDGKGQDEMVVMVNALLLQKGAIF